MLDSPTAPFAYHRTVRWGDCDPAGILYTPRAFDYATEALEAWWRDVVGVDWLALTRDHGHGAPMVNASCDFLRPMPPDVRLILPVHLEKLGRSTLTFAIPGIGSDGTTHFRARMVACVTDFRAGKAVALPAFVREPVRRYFEACRCCTAAP